jgi:hypothetical protein
MLHAAAQRVLLPRHVASVLPHHSLALSYVRGTLSSPANLTAAVSCVSAAIFGGGEGQVDTRSLL